MGKKWDKFLSTVKGAAHSTKKSVVRAVDVSKQKSAINHKKNALEDMYAQVGKFVCSATTTGGIQLSGSGIQGNVACKETLDEFLILEAEFKDEIARMEKMLVWLQTHDVVTKAETMVEQTEETDCEAEQEQQEQQETSQQEPCAKKAEEENAQ